MSKMFSVFVGDEAHLSDFEGCVVGRTKKTFCSHTLQSLQQEDILAAQSVVILFRMELLQKLEFNTLLKYVLKRCGHRKGRYFRCYVFPQDMSPEEFMQLVDSHKYETLNQLADIIHLSKDRVLDSADLDNALYRFAKQLPNEKRFYFQTLINTYIKATFGIAGQALQILGALFLLLRGLAWLSENTPELAKIAHPLYAFFSANEELIQQATWFSVATVCILAASMLLYLFHEGAKASSFGTEIMRKLRTVWDKALLLSILLLPFLASAIIGHFNLWPSFSVRPFILALLIDVVRRAGYSGRKALMILHLSEKNHSSTLEELGANLRNDRYGGLSAALRFPYTAKGNARIFISYTHTSDWSQRVVNDLYPLLLSHGTIVFVDQHNISLGANWRRAIHDRMADSTHVICLADETSVQKPWPAAEIEAAMRLRKLSHTPRIIVLAKKDLDVSSLSGIKPVFQHIFSNENSFDPPVQMIREQPGLLNVLANSLGCPDVNNYVLHTKLQSIIRPIFTQTGVALFYLIHLVTVIWMGWGLVQYGAISSGRTTSFESIPSWLDTPGTISWNIGIALLMLTCALTATSLWYEHFWIHRFEKTGSTIISKIIRVMCLLLSIDLLRMLAPNINISLWAISALCGILGVIFAGEDVYYKTELKHRYCYRGDSPEDMVKIEYDKSFVSAEYAQAESLYQSIAPEMKRCFDGHPPPLEQHFGALSGDIRLHSARDKLRDIIPHSISGGNAWQTGELYKRLGYMEAFLGNYLDAAIAFQKSIIFLHGNILVTPIEFSDNTLLCMLHIVKSYQMLGDMDNLHSTAHALRKICCDRIRIAETKVKDEVIRTGTESLGVHAQLAVNWKGYAENVLEQLNEIINLEEE